MRPVVVTVAAVTVALAGCSGGGSGGETGSTSTITVSAASSLTGAFREIGTAFTQRTGTAVTFNFGGSSALAEQINGGAPVDVFAAASASTMQAIIDRGNAASPVIFATNTLQIATPPGNPAGVVALAQLADPSVTVAACRPEVPCGAAAVSLFERNGLAVTPVTLEPDVRSVLGKVISDEVDAGVVYVTDVVAASDMVTGIAIPAESNVITTYPAAAISSSTNATAAAAFVGFLTSTEAQAILADAGFAPPP